MKSAPVNSERVPFEPAKHPRGKFDQLAKTEISKRREYAHRHCQQDQLYVFELIDAQRKSRSSHQQPRPVNALTATNYTPRKRCATARNSSRRSRCTQWPALSIVTDSACLNAWMRPSLTQSPAHDSVPRISNVGHVMRPQISRASRLLNIYGEVACT